MAAGDGWDVIKQPLFATVVLGLTGLFFVVTGVQYVLRGGSLRGWAGATERERAKGAIEGEEYATNLFAVFDEFGYCSHVGWRFYSNRLPPTLLLHLVYRTPESDVCFIETH
jgi:hypothetical protein